MSMGCIPPIGGEGSSPSSPKPTKIFPSWVQAARDLRHCYNMRTKRTRSPNNRTAFKAKAIPDHPAKITESESMQQFFSWFPCKVERPKKLAKRRKATAGEPISMGSWKGPTYVGPGLLPAGMKTYSPLSHSVRLKRQCLGDFGLPHTLTRCHIER